MRNYNWSTLSLSLSPHCLTSSRSRHLSFTPPPTPSSGLERDVPQFTYLRFTSLGLPYLDAPQFASLVFEVSCSLIFVMMVSTVKAKAEVVTCMFHKTHCGWEQPWIVSTGPLAHSLAPPCLLLSRTPLRSFVCSLAHSLLSSWDVSKRPGFVPQCDGCGTMDTRAHYAYRCRLLTTKIHLY